MIFPRFFTCKRSGTSRLYYYYFAAFLRAALYHQKLVHYKLDNVPPEMDYARGSES